MSMRIETASDVQARRDVLLQLAQTEGSALRKLFHSKVADEATDGTSDTMIRLPVGDRTFYFDKHGNSLGVDGIAEEKKILQFNGLKESKRVVMDGSVHGNYWLDKFKTTPVPTGVVLIVGAANTAKTPLAIALAAASGDFIHIRHGEPLAGYSNTDLGLAQYLVDAILNYPDVAAVVVDSFKDILITAPGAAMSSGLSRGVWPMLSDLSSLFNEVGKSLLIPINPATLAEGVVDMVVESAKSNVAMVLAADTEHGVWVSTARQGEGLQRVNSRIRTKFEGKNSLLSITTEGSTSARSPQARVISTQAPISDSDFDSVLRRNFNHTRSK